MSALGADIFSCLKTIYYVIERRRPMTEVHLSHVTPKFVVIIEQQPIRSKFLVAEKKHYTQAKILVRDSVTRFLAGELGSSAMGLSVA